MSEQPHSALAETEHTRKIKGFWATLGVFSAWGFLPIYWKSLSFIEPFLILLHRIFWSFWMLLLMRAQNGGLRETFACLRDKGYAFKVAVRSLLISCNWLIFIWAVNTGYVIETSLGYFMSPLVHMLCGIVFFRERPRPLQRLAIGLAVVGVGVQVGFFGDIPWVALSLSVLFALYGAMRKADKRGAVEGLLLETTLILPFTIAGLIWYVATSGAGLAISPLYTILIICAGPFTGLPLVLFAYGAQRLNLTTVGIIQYIYPTIILFLGLFLYQEAVTAGAWTSFAFIWAALLVYSFESVRLYKQVSPQK